VPIEFEQATADAQALIGDTKSLVRAVFSGRRRNMQPHAEKIELRPVQIKDEIKLQVIEIAGTTSKTSNIAPDSNLIIEHMNSGFANILIESVTQSMTIRFTKKGDAQVFIEAAKNQQSLSHDKQKQRMLDATDPFLREVGIADAHGRIKPTKQDKYLQVEEFLRILVPALTSAVAADHIEVSDNKPMTIVDHGCGNAYLTFAAHQYLRETYSLIKVIGIDIREQSRRRNSEIADRLGITDSIEFRAEAIAATEIDGADIMIALHACDTATDDAIAWAINHGSKLLLVAPCCHHDIQMQLIETPEPWPIILKHGILKERFGDILTDAIRAQILRIMGYRTEIIEFVGDEHTPRNIMIRAIKTDAPLDQTAVDRYKELVSFWNLTPKLSQLVKLPV
jgi:SAM-dependent methyltransferase